MSEELKTCPFCGGEAYIVPGAYRDGGYIENFARVNCTKCGANGGTFSECLPFDVVEQMAEYAWNRRAERTCHVEVSHGSHGPDPRFEGDVWTVHHVCSECGGAIDRDDAYCKNCGAKVVGE